MLILVYAPDPVKGLQFSLFNDMIFGLHSSLYVSDVFL